MLNCRQSLLFGVVVMKSKRWHFVGAAILVLVALCVSAADSGITGSNWVSWNDKTNSPGSVIKFFTRDDQYFGKIVKTADPNRRCTQCLGQQRNHPILGLILVRNVSTTLVNGKYPDGWILDPDTGKEYHCSLQLAEAGQQLKLRVTKGIFGKTLVWKKEIN